MLSTLRARAGDLYHAATDERFRAFNARHRISDLHQRQAAADRFAAGLPRSPRGAGGYDPADLSSLTENGCVALPYGLHRGVPPRAGPRLILQPLYALRPLIYGPKRPPLDSSEAPAGLGRHVNRVFVRF